MKRRSFLKILGLTPFFPKVAIDLLASVKTTVQRAIMFFGYDGKFFIGDKKEYIAYNGKELKIKGKIIK